MSYDARSSSWDFWVDFGLFWLSSGWWSSGSLTMAPRVGGGLVRVMERFERNGMGSGVDWVFWGVSGQKPCEGICGGEGGLLGIRW